MNITDDQLEVHRIAGEITLILELGSPQERASLLRCIGSLNGPEKMNQLDTLFPPTPPTTHE